MNIFKSSLIFFLILSSFVAPGQETTDAQEKKEESGYVVVGFSVNPSEGVREVYVMKGISPEIDQKAIQYIQGRPELKNGPSASYFLPVRMKLNTGTTFAKTGTEDKILNWEQNKVQQKDIEQIREGLEWKVDFYLAAVITGIQSKRLETKVFNQLWLENATVPNRKNSQNLLPLLQLCFDTNELYARKLKKKIKKSKLNSIYADVVDLKDIEAQFKGERDFRIIKILKETEYGSNTAALEQWQKQIQKELDKLKRYR